MRSILTALQDGRLFELPDCDKASTLEFLARILDANPVIEAGTDVIEEIKRRELECNTGIGSGVGVPHIRGSREEGELYCAIGWSSQGIKYEATDAMRVHLVFMYYIPGSQKNVYLKEISTLVKAIRKSGGIEPIAHADGLNTVRNLLLDWVSSVLNDTGPEAVARMIKLEVKHTLAQAAPIISSAEPAAVRALAFRVLVSGQGVPVILSHDSEWLAALEKEIGLGQKLAAGASFTLAGRQVYVTQTTAFAGEKLLYDCVALPAKG